MCGPKRRVRRPQQWAAVTTTVHGNDFLGGRPPPGQQHRKDICVKLRYASTHLDILAALDGLGKFFETGHEEVASLVNAALDHDGVGARGNDLQAL